MKILSRRLAALEARHKVSRRPVVFWRGRRGWPSLCDLSGAACDESVIADARAAGDVVLEVSYVDSGEAGEVTK
jgi:hypothetical protein